MFQTIGFIGCGNMGGALARAAAGKGRLFFADPHAEKTAALEASLGGTVTDNETIAATCELIFLGVKPQKMERMFAPLREILASRKDRFVLVSMAAALSMDTVAQMAGGDYPIIRIMPNTAVCVGAGMIQACSKHTTQAETDAFCELMQNAGVLDLVDEHLLDAAGSVSGCGPAFLCLALEGMADGGVACGLPREKALLYAAQTIYGLGKMAQTTGAHPGVLKDQVTSPGGTTIQGVRALENAGVRAGFMEAVIAAYEKTLALRDAD